MLQPLASWEKGLWAFEDGRKSWFTFVKAYKEPRFNISKADPDYFVFV